MYLMKLVHDLKEGDKKPGHQDSKPQSHKKADLLRVLFAFRVLVSLSLSG